MPKKWFLIILAIVIIPVTMVCWRVILYSRESKLQVIDLHAHIVNAMGLSSSTYFQQLNMRLAFAPLLTRTREWGQQVNLLNSALLTNSDFAGAALLDFMGREKAKAFDSKLNFLRLPLDYAPNPLFRFVSSRRMADTGSVYEREGSSFFDLLYPMDNNDWLLVIIRWDSLKKLLFDQQVGKSGFIWVLDATGRIVGDSRNQATRESTLPHWTFFEDRLKERVFWEGEFVDPKGVACVGAGHWIESAGWFVLSAQPQSEAYAKIWELRRKAFTWVFISIVGMGIFAYFWVMHISKPIMRLAHGVKNVAAKRFDDQVPEDFGLEEFRALGQAFNQMTRELKVYNELQVEKIIDEKTKVESLLFSIQDGILMLDDKGGLLFTNAPVRAWVMDVAGRGKGAPFEKSWESLQEYPPWMDVLGPVLSDEKKSMTEVFEFPVQGRKKWARVIAQQVSTQDGRRLGIMVVVRDVTADKELDRMKEDFFNGITHDLRAPLAATIGYLGLSEIQVPAGEKELGTLLGSARQSAKRAMTLVETILSLARLQAGRLNMTLTPTNAQTMLKKIAGDLSYQSLAKKVTLAADCDDPTIWINVDRALIERVIENLAGNAIKYTMEGGWVKLGARRTATDQVEVYIQDNGRGIPPEAVKKLFGKFQQVRDEDRQVGFGIGLAFSQGIVEAHASKIEVESEVGKGSTFSFVLDRVDAPAAAAKKAA